MFEKKWLKNASFSVKLTFYFNFNFNFLLQTFFSPLIKKYQWWIFANNFRKSHKAYQKPQLQTSLSPLSGALSLPDRSNHVSYNFLTEINPWINICQLLGLTKNFPVVLLNSNNKFSLWENVYIQLFLCCGSLLLTMTWALSILWMDNNTQIEGKMSWCHG